MTLNYTDGEASVPELWGMWSTLFLPLLPGPILPGVPALIRPPPMGQIELFKHLIVRNVKLNCVIAILETI